MDEQKLKINMTLITDVTPGDPTMEDEIFGPILPIIAINNVEEAIEIVNSKWVCLTFSVRREGLWEGRRGRGGRGEKRWR